MISWISISFVSRRALKKHSRNPQQTSKIENFTAVNYFEKLSILDDFRGPGYASAIFLCRSIFYQEQKWEEDYLSLKFRSVFWCFQIVTVETKR